MNFKSLESYIVGWYKFTGNFTAPIVKPLLPGQLINALQIELQNFYKN